MLNAELGEKTEKNGLSSPVLVTGVAGFIGAAVARQCLDAGCDVVGIDNLNSYYDVNLKKARLAQLEGHNRFRFEKLDIAEETAVAELFTDATPKTVIHLAAQAGVRHSLHAPFDYAEANLRGFLAILEACRAGDVAHLVYASTSSVYGARTDYPLSEHKGADHPVSLYAATKRSNELMAHAYSHLFGIPVTGLRFFTVYGPWGRPDMALFRFTERILKDEPIDVYNQGDMVRDFTYIDDIAAGVFRLAGHIPAPAPDWNSTAPSPATSYVPYRVYNIGSNRPVRLNDMIAVLEDALGRKAIRNELPMQPGDVQGTHADVRDLIEDCGFAPQTRIETGIPRFVEWYKNFYQV